MDLQTSINTLNSLANGLNPSTGEAFTADSPYNAPETIRALFVCLNVINNRPKAKLTPEQRQQENQRKGLPKNAGLPWTPQVKDALEMEFNNGVSFDKLAISLERTLGSVKAQLVKQGLIKEEDLRRL
ncbi:hypothetical protein AADZ86_01590 [Colwelliaceae bacterium BS250]